MVISVIKPSSKDGEDDSDGGDVARPPKELSCVLSAAYWDGGRYVVRGFLRYELSSQLSPNSSPYSSQYSSGFVPSVLGPILLLRLQRPPSWINEASRATETRRRRHRRHRRRRHRHRRRWGDRLLLRQFLQNHKYITMLKKKLGSD